MNRTEFKRKWLDTFVPNLTKKQYDDWCGRNYLWEVFINELVSKEKVLTGDSAREAYRNINKDNAIVIQIEDEIETSEIIEEYKQWEVIEYIPELYVVDKEWKWTYISTHENGLCGPYFYKI